MPDVIDEINKPVAQGRWYAGMPSPNPGGRRKADVRLQDLAREHTEEALKTIIDLMKDAKTPRLTKLACARELLDRGWGKPMQMTEMAFVPPADEESPGLPEVARRLAFILTATEAPKPRVVHSEDPT
jgi:hypothetical protein